MPAWFTDTAREILRRRHASPQSMTFPEELLPRRLPSESDVPEAVAVYEAVVAAYRKGFGAGYVKGFDDGRTEGYNDAIQDVDER